MDQVFLNKLNEIIRDNLHNEKVDLDMFFGVFVRTGLRALFMANDLKNS
jgi:hypothetical protein